MKNLLKKHVYTSKGEKIKHFINGLIGWSVIGTLVLALFLIGVLAKDIYFLTTESVYWGITLIFIILVTYFTATKHWVAIGLVTNVLLNILMYWNDGSFLDIVTFLTLPPPIFILFLMLK